MSSSTYADGIEDLRLPQAVVSRLIKDALPQGVIVSKEARTAISRAATVFILHATTYAECCAISNKRKTVTAADVITAIGKLDCDDLERPLREAVELWKSTKQQKLDEAKRRKVEKAHEHSSVDSESVVAGGSNSDTVVSSADDAQE